MFGDARSCRVVLVAHCLLNQNSVVPGLARFGSMVPGIVELFKRFDLGILQLPCPETLFYGLKRWWMTREQYDNPGYRSLCLKLSRLIANYVIEYTRCGIDVIGLVGIAGSPSCGVYTTNIGWSGGKPAIEKPSSRVRGRGIFIETLLEVLKKHSIELKILIEYDHRDPEKSLREIEHILRQKLELNNRGNTLTKTHQPT